MRRIPIRTLSTAVVLTLAVAACGTNKSSSTSSGPATTVASSTCSSGTSGGVPITYNQAKDGGCTGKFTWSKYCDTTTGRLKVPGEGPECVPAFSGDNGGATSPGITATTIKVARYVGKSDPATDAFLNSIGARDDDAAVTKTYNAFIDLYNTMAEFYGRKIQVVTLQGTGTSTDAVAARADALKAKEMGVFAVIGGPSQTRAFSEELARQGIIDIGGGTATGDFIQKHSPYVWGIGPSPEQTAQRTTEFIQKQLVGKKAQYAGDPALRSKTRVFGAVHYDTPAGQQRKAFKTFNGFKSFKGLFVIVSIFFDAFNLLNLLNALNILNFSFSLHPSQKNRICFPVPGGGVNKT